MLNNVIETLLFPPGLPLVLFLLGLLLRPGCRKMSTTMWFSGLLILYLASIPWVSESLLHQLSPYPALTETTLQPSTAQTSTAGAIVILGGGQNTNAPEYGHDTVSEYTLTRIRYGAWLQRKTGLPILVTGGIVGPRATLSEAQHMAETLQQEFNSIEVWQEGESHDTFENARYSKTLLAEKGIQHIYLVSHAWHLPRAVEAFQQQGLQVTPAPTAFTRKPDTDIDAFLPNSKSLQQTRNAMHEYIGRLWYRLRHYP